MKGTEVIMRCWVGKERMVVDLAKKDRIGCGEHIL